MHVSQCVDFTQHIHRLFFLFEILKSPLHIFSSITLLKGCKWNNFLNKISRSEAIKITTLVMFQIFTQQGNTAKDEMSLEGLFLCWQLRLSSSSSWLTALTFHKQSFQRLTGYLEGARSVQGLLFFFSGVAIRGPADKYKKNSGVKGYKKPRPVWRKQCWEDIWLRW